MLIRLGRAGIVHGDFNEFNLLIGEGLKVTLIDFPQIVHLTHLNAREFFDRDVRSICEWFRRKCDLEVEEYPSFDDILAEVEADNGAVLAMLNVQGISRDDDALLVAAHGNATDPVREPAPGDDDEDEDEDSEGEAVEDAEKERAEAPEEFAGLVPEGGCRELAEPGDDIDGLAVTSEAQAAAAEAGPAAGGYPNASSVEPARVEPAEDSDEEDSGDESSDASEGPGQVAVASAKRKTRKRQSAKEARTNLQRQQKTKPAKANNQKVREMRNARHQVKEFLM